MPKNRCFQTVVFEKTLESPLDCKEIQPVHPKGDQSRCSLEGLMLKLKLQSIGHLIQRVDSLKRPWCWERLKAGGKGDNRGWDGWMASPTRWTGVWANSWMTGKVGVLQSMGWQRLGLNCANEHYTTRRIWPIFYNSKSSINYKIQNHYIIHLKFM